MHCVFDGWIDQPVTSQLTRNTQLIPQQNSNEFSLCIGCTLNIVFFDNFKIYSGLWPLSVFQRCVHGRHNGR